MNYAKMYIYFFWRDFFLFRIVSFATNVKLLSRSKNHAPTPQVERWSDDGPYHKKKINFFLNESLKIPKNKKVTKNILYFP